MCSVISASVIVRYRTAGVEIVKICVQFLLLVVLYRTVLQGEELLKCVFSYKCFCYLRYRTAGVEIVKICVQFLLLVVLYRTVLRGRNC